ncbi:MAG: hypothetical protein LBG78_00765 [Azoarcus sp.]|nr:hypothetical protein [Azoarcus sp.]
MMRTAPLSPIAENIRLETATETLAESLVIWNVKFLQKKRKPNPMPPTLMRLDMSVMP